MLRFSRAHQAKNPLEDRHFGARDELRRKSKTVKANPGQATAGQWKVSKSVLGLKSTSIASSTGPIQAVMFCCLPLSASLKTNGYERCLGALTADADIRSRDSFSEPRGYFKGAETQAKRRYK